jgi:hypothetical protein
MTLFYLTLFLVELSSEQKKLAEITRKYEDMESQYKKQFDEYSELTKDKHSNDRDLVRLQSDNENLKSQLEDKNHLIKDKDKRLEVLEREYSTASKNFSKAQKKIEFSSEQINKGNEVIKELNKKKTQYKKKYEEVAEKYKDISAKHDDYYRSSESELKELRKAKFDMSSELETKTSKISEQENHIGYLNRKLNEEHDLNMKTGMAANNVNKFTTSFKPPMTNTFSGAPSGDRNSVLPRTSTPGYTQPSGPTQYQSAFKNRYDPSHTSTSPMSKYSEHKTLNTPSTHSVQSVNFTGMSAQNSISSFQVNNIKNSESKNKLGNYGTPYNEENGVIDYTRDQNKENTSTMNMIHTTKPTSPLDKYTTDSKPKGQSPDYSMAKTNDVNIFERQKQSDPDSD